MNERSEDKEYISALHSIITAFECSWCESCSRGLDAHTIVNVNGMPFAYCEHEPYEYDEVKA
tara:strand:+ start:187 stop:372 length:186 start_codon:yes stop_codon:yes gene_type:complete